MRMKNFLLVGILCLWVMSSLCGCEEQHAASEDKIYVGFAYYAQSDTFISELLECFKTEIEKVENDNLTISVMVREAGGSQRTQNDQVEELIDAGCDVLCVNLVDRADPSEIIDLARDYDIPLIFFNREPVQEDMMQWDKIYYVGADAQQSGELQGELATDWIEHEKVDRNKDGVIQYVVLEGEPDHQDTIIRTESAVNTLRERGIELEKLSYQTANWNRVQAQNRMNQMIGQFKNNIELVLANNDDMALGAIDAYEKLNYSEESWPVFFGIDGTDEGLQALKDGKLTGTVYNDKEGQAESMAVLAVALVTGEGIEDIEFEDERYIYRSYFKITDDNVDYFLGRE
ncbi:MAG: galactose ABC transporter substrate-binding protein [Clostridiales bacterium]|nr:galactose ABC transporter substrate-binding protein [Clostridiales bacterium]